jgi:hypothetical protein
MSPRTDYMQCCKRMVTVRVRRPQPDYHVLRLLEDIRDDTDLIQLFLRLGLINGQSINPKPAGQTSQTGKIPGLVQESPWARVEVLSIDPFLPFLCA